MIAQRIHGTTRDLGKPMEWEADGRPCGVLAIRDEITTVGPVMASAWQPTDAELERLNAGASVILTVCGAAHPPVSIGVGLAPK